MDWFLNSSSLQDLSKHLTDTSRIHSHSYSNGTSSPYVCFTSGFHHSHTSVDWWLSIMGRLGFNILSRDWGFVINIYCYLFICVSVCVYRSTVKIQGLLFDFTLRCFGFVMSMKSSQVDSSQLCPSNIKSNAVVKLLLALWSSCGVHRFICRFQDVESVFWHLSSSFLPRLRLQSDVVVS